jgi:hypothetical protein
MASRNAMKNFSTVEEKIAFLNKELNKQSMISYNASNINQSVNYGEDTTFQIYESLDMDFSGLLWEGYVIEHTEDSITVDDRHSVLEVPVKFFIIKNMDVSNLGGGIYQIPYGQPQYFYEPTGQILTRTESGEFAKYTISEGSLISGLYDLTFIFYSFKRTGDKFYIDEILENVVGELVFGYGNKIES